MSIFTYTIPKFDQTVKTRNVAIPYAMQEVEGKPWNGGTISSGGGWSCIILTQEKSVK